MPLHRTKVQKHNNGGISQKNDWEVGGKMIDRLRGKWLGGWGVTPLVSDLEYIMDSQSSFPKKLCNCKIKLFS